MRSIIRIDSFAILLLSAGICFGQTQAKSQVQTSKPDASAATQTPKPQAAKEKEADSDDLIPIPGPNALFPAIVARVNGKAVAGSDLEQRVQSELAPIGNPAWQDLREDYRMELTQQSLASLIGTELLYQEAVESGVAATAAETQAEFAKIAKSFNSDAEMNSALAGRGLDRAALNRMVARNLIVAKYVDENVNKKILVTTADLTQYYSSHTAEFQHPEMVRTSHILIAVPEGASAEQRKAARVRAEALLARVKKGEDFGKLAIENSTDPSASQRGDIGYFGKGDLAPEYEAAAFALQVGQVSDPVLTQYGYHIIKVTDRKKEGLSTLEEAKEQLTTFLKNQKAQAELEKLINGLRRQAKIEILMPIGAASQPPGASSSANTP